MFLVIHIKPCLFFLSFFSFHLWVTPRTRILILPSSRGSSKLHVLVILLLLHCTTCSLILLLTNCNYDLMKCPFKQSGTCGSHNTLQLIIVFLFTKGSYIVIGSTRKRPLYFVFVGKGPYIFS